MDRILIVICTFNEIENLPRMVSLLLETYSERYDILVVDDHSPDGTWKWVEDEMEKEPRLKLVDRKDGEKGRGAASRVGYGYFVEHSEYDAMLEIDADFSHNPKDIARLTEAMENNKVDYVIGSRYLDSSGFGNYPWNRVWMSKLTNFFFRFILGLKIKDASQSFQLTTRRAMEKAQLDQFISNGFSVFLELKWYLKHTDMKYMEIPIVIQDREKGLSKMSLNQMILLLKLVFHLKITRLFK